MKIVAVCLVLLLLAGTCTAYYTRGEPSSSEPRKSNPEYNALAEKLFYWNGDFRNIGDIVIEMRAQQGAKVLGHGRLQEAARLGATGS